MIYHITSQQQQHARGVRYRLIKRQHGPKNYLYYITILLYYYITSQQQQHARGVRYRLIKSQHGPKNYLYYITILLYYYITILHHYSSNMLEVSDRDYQKSALSKNYVTLLLFYYITILLYYYITSL